jgi:predicted NAD-dependent protein-ADP-ribosyltransferase YbiA (DUF1768 family)
MDVGSRNSYPAGALSNFSPHPFEFRGVSVNSMEGLLQSFKFKGEEMQRHICTLVGFAAKKAGSKKNWYESQTLWWQGQPIKRDSQEYQDMLDEAYEAMFTQNENARKALLATNNATLTHSIGKRKINETVLTEREFCRRLTRIREELKSNTKLLEY